MKLHLFLFIFLFFSTSAFAQERYNASVTHEHNVDTDANRLDLNHVRLATGQSDIFWLYPNEPEQMSYWQIDAKNTSGESQGNNFDGERVALSYGYKASSTKSVELSYGYHELDVDNSGESRAFGIGKIVTKSYWLDQKLGLTASFEKDLAYADLDVPASLDDFKRKDIYSFMLQYRYRPKWRILSRAVATNFSDENERKALGLEVLYGISNSWPWIWIGAFYDMSENSKDIAGYWTPEDFRNYGIKFEAAFPVYKKLSASGEIKQYRLRENFGEWGDGHTYAIGLQYGDRGHNNFRINFLDIESKQDGSAWSQDKTTFQYNHAF